MYIHYENINLIALKSLAIALSSDVRVGDVILLKGQLGAGKTTFAKLLINALLKKEEQVLSPTFNLVYTYQSDLCQIWHFDLYRLKVPNDVYNLGIEDALRYGISIIEWPEIIIDMLPERALSIEFEVQSNKNLRNIIIGNYKKTLNLNLEMS